jgi:lipid-A-disaccharide synthase
MHARGIPVIYFVAPQLWAWREYRVKRMQKWIKKVLCIFPFEEAFYRKYQVDAEYVGHPLADMPKPQISRQEYAAKYKLDAAKEWIALLPGSRKKEIAYTYSRLMSVVFEDKPGGELPPISGGRFPGHKYQFILPVAPTISTEWLRKEHAVPGVPGISVSFTPLGKSLDSPWTHTLTYVEDARAALLHSRAAVVTSGTATVEAALMGTPFIAVYRLSPLTFFAAKRLVKVPHVAMPNLIAGRQIVPELLQDDFTSDNVAAHLHQIVEDGELRSRMLAGLAEVQAILHRDGEPPAVERAADAIMKSL